MSPCFSSWTRRTVATSGAVVFAAALVGCGDDAPPPELPPRAIQWERVSSTLEGEPRVVSGIVTAIDDTRLAFEVAGTVETVEVSLGDEVEQGDVLARLDPEPLELAVSDAEAALAEATAMRAVARADFSRAKSLFEADVASRQEYDRAIARRDSRSSQVEAAEARLNLARRDLRRSVLKAPFRGVISVREVDPAMSVAAGQTVFEMDSEESGLRVEVQMPESLVARVRQGDEVVVRFPAKGDARFDVGDEHFAAVVAEVGTRAGAGNAFPVRADLQAAPPGLRPGMTAEVTFSIPLGTGDVPGLEGFLIPMAAALAEPDDRFSAFVYDSDTGTVEKRSIRTGGLADNHVAVLEGLAEGDVIATAGVTFLSDGQKVTLLDERLGGSRQ